MQGLWFGPWHLPDIELLVLGVQKKLINASSLVAKALSTSLKKMAIAWPASQDLQVLQNNWHNICLVSRPARESVCVMFLSSP